MPPFKIGNKVIKKFVFFVFTGINEGRFRISICLCDSIMIVKAFFKVVVVDVEGHSGCIMSLHYITIMSHIVVVSNHKCNG